VKVGSDLMYTKTIKRKGTKTFYSGVSVLRDLMDCPCEKYSFWQLQSSHVREQEASKFQCPLIVKRHESLKCSSRLKLHTHTHMYSYIVVPVQTHL